jgi:hypothetical protein
MGEPSKDLPSPGKDLVQRLPEKGGGFREVAPDLVGIFLPALLDLLLEKLLQIAVPQALLPLARMVNHHIGDQRPGEPPGLERGVLR